MLWIDSIWDETHFCTCLSGWLSMKIVHAVIRCDIIKVYMTAEDGKRCKVLTMSRGQNIPAALGEMRVKPFEHVKIEVKGGEITVLGWVQDGLTKRPSTGFFPHNCPFAGEEEWNRKPIKQKEEEEPSSAGLTKLKVEDSDENFKMKIV